MIKDLLKIMLSINADTNLNPNEKVILSNLILNHNIEMGYSFPTYENLMTALSTNRRAKVSDTLKSLVEKEYITIKKIKGNKSIYFVQKHLYFSGVAKQKSPLDSDGKAPLRDQIHIDEVIQDQPDPKVLQISDYTGFNADQSKELLKECGNDPAKVIRAFDFTKRSKNVQDQFKFTKWAIKNPGKIEIEYKPKKAEGKTVSKFNNFDPRSYDYDRLERKLLGWDDEGSYDPIDYMIK